MRRRLDAPIPARNVPTEDEAHDKDRLCLRQREPTHVRDQGVACACVDGLGSRQGVAPPAGTLPRIGGQGSDVGKREGRRMARFDI